MTERRVTCLDLLPKRHPSGQNSFVPHVGLPYSFFLIRIIFFAPPGYDKALLQNNPLAARYGMVSINFLLPSCFKTKGMTGSQLSGHRQDAMDSWKWDGSCQSRQQSIDGILPRIPSDTVDGRNPAPVDRWFIPLFVGFQPSKVVQDFSHQQYHCQASSSQHFSLQNL